MTHALMIPAMRATRIMMIAGVDADDTKTALLPGISIGGTASTTGPHVTTTEATVMVANHATMIAAMKIDDTELGSRKVCMPAVLRYIRRFYSVNLPLP